jgi:hypothetical protein
MKLEASLEESNSVDTYAYSKKNIKCLCFVTTLLLRLAKLDMNMPLQ